MSVAEELEAMRGALAALEQLDDEGRKRAVRWLADALGVSATGGTELDAQAIESVGSSPASAIGGDGPKHFLARKKPRTAVEQVACLAYYLTHAKSSPHFKTRDLSQLNVEAAGPPFTNISQAAKDAVKGYYLASAGKQNRQITPLGESIVEALPDRAAVKAILAEDKPRPRARRRARPTSQ